MLMRIKHTLAIAALATAFLAACSGDSFTNATTTTTGGFTTEYTIVTVGGVELARFAEPKVVFDAGQGVTYDYTCDPDETPWTRAVDGKPKVGMPTCVKSDATDAEVAELFDS